MSSDQINRRDFLIKASKYSSLSLLALNFGCSISRFLDDSTQNIALIYATKYGATKETADWINEGMGRKADLLDIEDIDHSEIASRYSLFIVGSGIWIGGVHNKLVDFLTSEAEKIDGKVIASFVVCGTDGTKESGKRRISGYFDKFHKPLTELPKISEYFGGRIIVEKLTDEDREALVQFYRRFLKTKLTSWDKTDPNKANLFGKTVKSKVI